MASPVACIRCAGTRLLQHINRDPGARSTMEEQITDQHRTAWEKDCVRGASVGQGRRVACLLLERRADVNCLASMCGKLVPEWRASPTLDEEEARIHA